MCNKVERQRGKSIEREAFVNSDSFKMLYKETNLSQCSGGILTHFLHCL